MKKYLLIFLSIFSLFFITDNVNALNFEGVREIRMYYTNDSGQTLSTNNIGFAAWGAYGTYYIDKIFDSGSFGNIPLSLYGFFTSGHGCVNKNCVLEGVVVSYTPNGLDNQNYLSSIKVELEANGSYKSCSIVDLSTEYNIYSYAKFQCANYNLNSGFNVVVSNFSVANPTKFGLAISSFKLLDNLTSEDIIVSNNNNTNNIINNNNQNTNNIINNQDKNQQETNDRLDNINDSLNNSNVDNGTGSNFFNDFSSSDNGGISSIVKAPLVAINSMLSNTCTAMSVTYKGKEVSLSCGTEFWSKASVIQNYLNWFEGGILVYLIIRKLYKLIESLKNPDDDRVEVMDL